jgi:hypothetical protein
MSYRTLLPLQRVEIRLGYVSPLLCALGICNYYAELYQSQSLYTSSHIFLYYILCIIFYGVTLSREEVSS